MALFDNVDVVNVRILPRLKSDDADFDDAAVGFDDDDEVEGSILGATDWWLSIDENRMNQDTGAQSNLWTN